MTEFNGEKLDTTIKNFFHKCAKSLLKSLSDRFRFIRDTNANAPEFKVLPSVATLLDFRYFWILLQPKNASLLTSAKEYIVAQLLAIARREQLQPPQLNGTGSEGIGQASQSSASAESARASTGATADPHVLLQEQSPSEAVTATASTRRSASGSHAGFEGIQVQVPAQAHAPPPPPPPPPKRFKHLEITTFQPRRVTSAAGEGTVSIEQLEALLKLEVNRFINSLRNGDVEPLPDEANIKQCIEMWKKKDGLPHLASLAKQVLSLPCSEAYVERIFSTCGILTSGRRNRMSKKLQQRVFLKHNLHLL